MDVDWTSAARPGRRGVALVFAMAFLVVFAVIAIAFASVVASSVKVTQVDRDTTQAQASAESGLEYIKAAVSQVQLSTTATNDQIMTGIYNSLSAAGTLPSGSVSATTVPPTASDTITIANGANDFIIGQSSIGQSSFKAYITCTPDPLPASQSTLFLRAKVVGHNSLGTVARSISVKFKPNTKTISGGSPSYPMFAYGVFSLGGISFTGGGAITGPPSVACVRSALTSGLGLNLTGSTSVAGMGYVATNIASQVSVANNTVNGQPRAYGNPGFTNWLNANFAVVAPPIPPVFDPTVFSQYATTTYGPSTSNKNHGTWTNIRIPAGSNLNISGDSTLQFRGIVYIESPNNITLGGGINNFNCVFVVANKKNDGTATTPGSDTLTLGGNNNYGPIDPNDSSLTAVRTATAGYSFLAPTANLSINASGTTELFVGSIIGYTAALTGNVVFKIQDGSVITYSTAPAGSSTPACNITGSSGVQFSRTANYQLPTNGISPGPGDTGGTTTVLQYILTDPAYSSYTEGN